MGARLAGSRVLAFGGTLRIRTWCSALVRQRLGGVGGGAPVHAQRTPAANREKAMTARRRACGVGRAIDGAFCKGPSQTNKQANKQTNKQTNRQTNRETKNPQTDTQTDRQTDTHTDIHLHK